MIDVIDIICSIEADKKSMNIVPSHALLSEINTEVMKLIKEELNVGVADGRLSWCETLNSYGFSVIKKE